MNVFVGKCPECKSVVAATTDSTEVGEWHLIPLTVEVFHDPVSVTGCRKDCKLK